MFRLFRLTIASLLKEGDLHNYPACLVSLSLKELDILHTRAT